MAVTAKMVKELREASGAGMMDCKKALTEADGDMAKATDILREKGLSKAAKKSGRIAAEGLAEVIVSEDSKIGAIVEVNSETDFVAKNEIFRGFVASVAKQALNSENTDLEAFLSEQYIENNEVTLKDELLTKIAKIGENLGIRRFAKLTTESGAIVSYTHAGGKIGVLVELECDTVNDTVKEAGRNVAMQIAALNPKHVDRSEVSAEYIEHEREVLKQQALNEGKPEAIVEKMVEGRLNKELKEICLVDQAYVKDGDLTVAKYLDQAGKEAGTKIAVKKFVRFETGEGIEKKEENFAEEVARQMGQ